MTILIAGLVILAAFAAPAVWMDYRRRRQARRADEEAKIDEWAAIRGIDDLGAGDDWDEGDYS